VGRPSTGLRSTLSEPKGRRRTAPVREGRAPSRSKEEFAARVLAVVRRIPPGRVATYGEVAALAGRPRAARAVGNIMRDCGRPDVPCHRVIAAGGRLGGYGGSEYLKRALLMAEGVRFRGMRVSIIADVRYRPAKAGRQEA
jgi:O-6-methylguanine DNA methyltransferase